MGCDSDGRYSEKYVLKEHTAKFNSSLLVRFWSSKPQHFNTWSRMIKREVVGEGLKKEIVHIISFLEGLPMIIPILCLLTLL